MLFFVCLFVYVLLRVLLWVLVLGGVCCCCCCCCCCLRPTTDIMFVLGVVNHSFMGFVCCWVSICLG